MVGWVSARAPRDGPGRTSWLLVTAAVSSAPSWADDGCDDRGEAVLPAA